MKPSKPFKVLFDTSLWNETVVREYYMVSKEIEWPTEVPPFTVPIPM